MLGRLPLFALALALPRIRSPLAVGRPQSSLQLLREGA
ncbi:hypothetical protein RSPO_m00443 (plasmid) [Ralstonia solanacearum Po82]|uniref:Uncharacterized protein n=1 Tax=Ralstonia solanacearum (strain Po82) TaxID=1031711 RepID=F6G8J1_RALS8|nr:hypothetical protein RSPO_m00443 [Ralstonia solanacearum Po82]